ncbi:SRPBCC family protein [Streptomyces ochraceiscleroticus]|uniref:SRPBCC family protein n=1 Tax=Streptomyces ochraceiscleroticus TaxID=47761 RepID=A0ABW1MP01_9ACTN|nr:SRPBCC family protein [Streptomyces ochraceiscleroticus]
MEWTGARYADGPTVEVDAWVGAAPERVWELVSDVELMPELSAELRSAQWLDGAPGPALGARFVGHSAHEALGEWQTTSYVVECDPPRAFAWAVGDPEHPTATWRFTLTLEDGGTRLRQWVRLGPGRSGLSLAIERMPEKEQKIVHVRLREFERNITATLGALKERAERAEHTGSRKADA